MNKIERIEYLKSMIDDMRADGCIKVADLFVTELVAEAYGQ